MPHSRRDTNDKQAKRYSEEYKLKKDLNATASVNIRVNVQFIGIKWECTAVVTVCMWGCRVQLLEQFPKISQNLNHVIQ